MVAFAMRKVEKEMKKSSSPTILLVTEDLEFYTQCQQELLERFDIEVIHFSEKDITRSPLSLSPCLILWDSRSYKKDWQHMISWLRDHFSGISILVVTQGENEDLSVFLQRQGIHTHLDINSPSFFKSVQVHIFAVLLDFEKKKTKPIRCKVS